MTSLERAVRLAQDDIQRLRSENAILRAKVEVMDLFAQVLRTKPFEQSSWMSEDAVHLLDKALSDHNKPEQD